MTTLLIVVIILTSLLVLFGTYMVGWYTGKMQGYDEGWDGCEAFWMSDDVETLITATMANDSEVAA